MNVKNLKKYTLALTLAAGFVVASGPVRFQLLSRRKTGPIIETGPMIRTAGVTVGMVGVTGEEIERIKGKVIAMA